MNLYPRNASAAVDEALFVNPTAEYRGTPFWSWNCAVSVPQLLAQIEQFKQMGMGGFHMHPRTGLATEYLGKDYFSAVTACVEKARAEGMLAWLYDEDRWPSGAAGGLVTKNERYRARHLLFSPVAYGDDAKKTQQYSAAFGERAENGRLLACYEVRLENGRLAHHARIDKDAHPAPGCHKWWAYLETATTSAWFNNQTYVDTLNPRAIEEFVKVTHDRYLAHVGKDFGGVVPAIFTDEPQFARKQHLRNADEKRQITLPFTDDLFDTYAQAYGDRLEPHLPELIWELPGAQASLARYRYHDHVAERFSSAFADTIGNWCAQHNIALTGHMMDEPTLQTQTHALGEAMRSYRSFHIPGIDMLCDGHEYTTAKQAQSAVHQYGRPGVLSELYGVTNWDFDFLGHIAQGNWQAALGVTVRVHHLMWVSMSGEAKRDYPASMGYQSPWWKEYPAVEDYFSRVNVLLTRGKPLVRVGVVHPVESFWLAYGPIEQTRVEREQREEQFRNITEWLVHGLVDFNFVCESLLPSQSEATQAGQFNVGQMNYDVVIVPGMRTIRSTTLERLESFADAGGKVLFAGDVPLLVDVVASDRASKLAARCGRIDFNRASILSAVEPYRELAALEPDGSARWGMAHQIRQDGKSRHVFICSTKRTQPMDGDRATPQGATTLRLRGEWEVTHRDAFTGQSEALAARYADGWTTVDRDIPAAGSVLLSLAPGRREAGASPDRRAWREVSRLVAPVPVSLSEPNVLLLDQAEWRIGESETWEKREEILRVDNLIRARLGMPARTGHICQPWADPNPLTVLTQVELRFRIACEVPVRAPKLAAELPEGAQVWLDDQRVEPRRDGWWTDEAIHTYPLPDLSAGKHELRLRLPFKRWPGLEWCYLLGDFGVRVLGHDATMIAPVRELAFGDWTQQGLPFYGGNVTYHCTLHADACGVGSGLTEPGVDRELSLQVQHFRAPFLTIDLDGKRLGPVMLPPYQIALGRLSPGAHKLNLTAYGSRINCFGQVHCFDPHMRWWGPQSWRTTGAAWSDEYQLKPTGVLTGPILRVVEG